MRQLRAIAPSCGPTRASSVQVKELLLTITPVSSGVLLKTGFANSQVLIVNHLIGPAASAVYFLTGRLFGLCESLLASVGSSISSGVSQMAAREDLPRLKDTVLVLFRTLSRVSALGVAFSLVMNKSFVELLLGPHQFGGYGLSVAFSVASFANSRLSFLLVTNIALARGGSTLAYEFAGIITKLTTATLLVPVLGWIALPVADCIVNLGLTAITIWFTLKNRLSLQTKEAIFTIASGVDAFMIAVPISIIWVYLFPEPQSWMTFFESAALLACAMCATSLILFRELRALSLDTFRLLSQRWIPKSSVAK